MPRLNAVFVTILLAVMAALIPLSTDVAYAKTYYVDDITDFIDAVEHAVSGDAIVFRSDIEIDLYNPPVVYLNTNGNGQYLPGNGNWELHNMSITITAASGVTVNITGFAIRFYNCDNSEISGLNLNTGVWVLRGSDNVEIRGNVFQNGHVLLLGEGSRGYTITSNAFNGGGGLLVDDVGGGGIVWGNTVNGLPLAYIESVEDVLTGHGNTYGQVVVVNSRSVTLQSLDMRREIIGVVAYPIVISGSNSISIVGAKLDHGTVRIFDSNFIGIAQADITEGDIRINIMRSTHVDIRDNNIREGTSHGGLPVVFKVEDSSSIRLYNNNARLNSSYLLMALDSDDLTIKNNDIKLVNEDAYIPIYIKKSNGVLLENNSFRAEHIRIGKLFPIFVQIMGSNSTVVKNNNFTAKTTDRDGTPTRYVDGVVFKVSSLDNIPNRDIFIAGNRFKGLDNGIVVSNMGIYSTPELGSKNVTIARNVFEETLIAVRIDPYPQNLTIACNFFNSTVIDVKRVYGASNVHIFMNAFVASNPISIFYQGSAGSSITNDTLNTPVPVPYEYNSARFTSKLGNYYSWHDNTDSNGDGIADNPVKLVSNVLDPTREVYDNFPIADPSLLLMCGTPLPSSLSGGGTGDAGGGEGSSSPPLIVSPTSVTFPPTEPGNTVSTTITISNTLGEAVELIAVSLRGETGVFAVNLSAPYTLPPGGSVVVKIAYIPRAYTSYSAVLAVTTNLTSEPTLEVTLTAQAKKAPPLPQHTLEMLGKRAEAVKRIGKLIATISNLPNTTASEASAYMVFQQLKRMDLDKLVNGVSVVSVTNDTLTLDANEDGKVDALDLVNYLSSQGLMKKPPKTSKAFSQQLLKTLQKLYGENLENYPTPEGKLWITALIIKTEQQE